MFESSIQKNIKRKKKTKTTIKNPQIQHMIPIDIKPINQRVFYHSQSHQVYTMNDEKTNLTEDSDDESGIFDQQLQEKGIFEFSDMNEGEKEMMNMWNIFIQNQTFFGMKHMPVICDMFIIKNIREIIQKQLYRNLLLHLCCLYDFDLLNEADFFHLVENVQSLVGIRPLKNLSNQNVYQSSDSIGARKVTRKRKRASSTNNNNDNNNDKNEDNNNTYDDSEYELNSPKRKHRRYGLRSSLE